jgi:hypothetical protein
MDVEDAQSSRRTSGRFGCRVAMLRPYKKELKLIQLFTNQVKKIRVMGKMRMMGKMRKMKKRRTK